MQAGNTACNHRIRLPYLRRQNSWQFLWLFFTTTNKRYTANFSMFVKLPTHRKTTLLSQKKNITELLHS